MRKASAFKTATGADFNTGIADLEAGAYNATNPDRTHVATPQPDRPPRISHIFHPTEPPQIGQANNPHSINPTSFAMLSSIDG
jgi:hypothetical protein